MKDPKEITPDNNIVVGILKYLYKQPHCTDNSINIKQALADQFSDDEVRDAITNAKNSEFIWKVSGETRNPIWQLTIVGLQIAEGLSD